MRQTASTLAALALCALAGAAVADTPATLAQRYESAARSESPAFAGLSAARGRQLFVSTHGNDWSCASCHTRDPRAQGKHAKTEKPIDPLAPSANPARFTDAAKVEKWFRRNCNDVMGRACTAQEKGDVLAYLMSLAR